MTYRAWPDRLGMCVALACALHCAGLTLVFLLYPTVWLNRSYWESGLWHKLLWLEWGLLALTWTMLLAAMLVGWLRHRHFGPVLLALISAGILTVLIATPLHFSGRWTALAAAGAGLLLAGAHFWNLHLGRCHMQTAVQQYFS